MDLLTFLTLAVGLIIVLRGYLLFNDLPRFLTGGPRRPARR